MNGDYILGGRYLFNEMFLLFIYDNIKATNQVPINN